MPAVVLLVDLQPGIESHQVGGFDTPEKQLGPDRKTSPRFALAAPVTLASRDDSFSAGCNEVQPHCKHVSTPSSTAFQVVSFCSFG